MKTTKYFIVLFIAFTLGCEKESEKETAEVKIEKTIEQAVNNFYFVGNRNGSPDIFHYNWNKKTYSPFFQSRKEKVVELFFNHRRDKAFVITASNFGKKGVFPFINNVKVYLMHPGNDSLQFLKALGDGLQVFSKWEDDNSFKVVLNNIDKTIAKYIEQQTVVYNTKGKLLFEENKRYDLEVEGYPPPLQNDPSNFSSENFKIEQNDSSIYLTNISSSEQLLISKIKYDLSKVEWSEDGNFLVFTTLDVSPSNETLYSREPKTSQLFIYSLKDKKLIKKFEGGGFKNFFIENNYLFFDDGFSDQSQIIIFDMLKQEEYDKINIENGCGIRSIPQRPDYSA